MRKDGGHGTPPCLRYEKHRRRRTARSEKGPCGKDAGQDTLTHRRASARTKGLAVRSVGSGSCSLFPNMNQLPSPGNALLGLFIELYAPRYPPPPFSFNRLTIPTQLLTYRYIVWCLPYVANVRQQTIGLATNKKCRTDGNRGRNLGKNVHPPWAWQYSGLKYCGGCAGRLRWSVISVATAGAKRPWRFSEPAALQDLYRCGLTLT